MTLEGALNLRADKENSARLAIATRYLGADVAHRFVEQRGTPSYVLTIDAHTTKTWDLAALLPKS